MQTLAFSPISIRDVYSVTRLNREARAILVARAGKRGPVPLSDTPAENAVVTVKNGPVPFSASPLPSADDLLIDDRERQEEWLAALRRIAPQWHFIDDDSDSARDEVDFAVLWGKADALLRYRHLKAVLSLGAGVAVQESLSQGPAEFADRSAWEAHLQGLGITTERPVRIASEGALLGSLSAHGVSAELVILRDGAPQFEVLVHASCWIPAERPLARMVPYSDAHRTANRPRRIRQVVHEHRAGHPLHRDDQQPPIIGDLHVSEVDRIGHDHRIAQQRHRPRDVPHLECVTAATLPRRGAPRSRVGPPVAHPDLRRETLGAPSQSQPRSAPRPGA
jgi:hypothetical protein